MSHFDRSRSPFRERVMALAGHGTFREPTAPGSAPGPNPMPADHVIAAALAFGRRDRDDVGPDVAVDMATGRRGHWRSVCLWLGQQLAADRSAACRRVRPWAAHYAVWAYNATVTGQQFPPAPEGVAAKDHGEVALFACLLLEQAAEDALALAARKWKAA